MEDKDNLILNLHSTIDFLHARIKELEIQNEKLVSQLAHCQCSKSEEKNDGSKERNNVVSEKCRKSRKKKSQGTDLRTLQHHSKRYIALKVMYFGQRFYGFSSEAQLQPTVESEMFRALEQTRLLLGDRKESQYSRCGRTDKGVSAAGQVIALYVRSNLKANTNSQEVISEDKEIDYVRILNKVLPRDIRIIGWCPVPADFHARFSCLGREYKYFFWRDNLDILSMQSAGKKLLGEHDFRNFCKMDALNVHNYKRNLTSFEIRASSDRCRGKELWSINIKGSAFLWHQVRCMVAVLFMIGQGLESEEIIDLLLDIEKTPKKPQYTMAPETPLILQACEFRDLRFFSTADARQALRTHLEDEWQRHMLQAAIFHNAADFCSSSEDDEGRSLLTGQSEKKYSHIPLIRRPTEPSYDERRVKLNSEARGKNLRIISRNDDTRV